MAEMELFSLRT